MIVDKINSYLSTEGKEIEAAILEETAKLGSWAFSKQFGVREKREKKAPYFSSIGKCLRQQAYGLLGYPEDGKELDSRAKMVFFMGDMAELAIVQVAKVAGVRIEATGSGQESVEWNGMRGRPDGIVDGTHVLEVKSMSSFSFRDFEGGKLDDGYRYQCNAAMIALNLKKTVIVALNKDAGVLAEMIIDRDPLIEADIKARLDTLAKVTKEDLPYRPYAPDAKGFLPWQCRYCAFYNICWPGSVLVPVSGKYKLRAKETTKITA